MMLCVEDASRQVAGDRFNIRLICKLTVPIRDLWFSGMTECPDTVMIIRKRLGETLEFQIEKQRNFVAESEKDEIVAELVGQIHTNLGEYLSSDRFPEKLFAARYKEEKEKAARAEFDEVIDSQEEDEGPADFSSCFVDK